MSKIDTFYMGDSFDRDIETCAYVDSLSRPIGSCGVKGPEGPRGNANKYVSIDNLVSYNDNMKEYIEKVMEEKLKKYSPQFTREEKSKSMYRTLNKKGLI